ncbi:MAG: hypothetical protein ACOX4A_02145 [Saccharofermentanales bacterium]|jgi:hypothetical protein
MKKILVVILASFILFSLCSCDTSLGETSVSTIKSTTQSSIDNQTSSLEAPLFSNVITDEALRLDFINACEQIGMDIERIVGLKQVDDWVSGPRYSFTYSGGAFRLYCNMDSTVNCIKLGVDTDIYKQGYEPYKVSDYIVDPAISDDLQTKTEDYVKGQLKYPTTAVFSLFDWSFGRERDLYSVSSKVSAKNAFGVEDEIMFKLIYQVDASTTTLMYFELDGTTVVNNMSSIDVPERKKIEDPGANSETETEAIVLKYGELGKYGKTISLDGLDYINYHVPAGKYTITNKGKLCKVFLAEDKYYKNSSGYMENKIVETIEFSSYDETKTIVVGKGEHLELTIHAKVTLVPTG